VNSGLELYGKTGRESFEAEMLILSVDNSERDCFICRSVRSASRAIRAERGTVYLLKGNSQD
jgi:hypothetical protein